MICPSCGVGMRWSFRPGVYVHFNTASTQCTSINSGDIVTKTHPSIVLVKHADETNSVYVKSECKVFRAGAEVADTYISEVSGDMWEIEIAAPKHNTMDQYSLRYSELY